MGSGFGANWVLLFLLYYLSTEVPLTTRLLRSHVGWYLCLFCSKIHPDNLLPATGYIRGLILLFEAVKEKQSRFELKANQVTGRDGAPRKESEQKSPTEKL